MSIEQAFEAFMTDNDAGFSVFESTVDASTKASWGGSGYSVELFPDGAYRILWDQSIGNRYSSPGVILKVPPLSDEEWDDDASIRYYGNVEGQLRELFKDVIENQTT